MAIAKTRFTQVRLPGLDEDGPQSLANGDNRVQPDDRAFHDWYRFVLSFPPHLVRRYLDEFDLGPGTVVLDPFCGTGTTLIEAKLRRVGAVGLEANPFPCFASRVKTDWSVDPDVLAHLVRTVSQEALDLLSTQGIDDASLCQHPPDGLRSLDPDAMKALIGNSISPLPLHKTLVLLDVLRRYEASDGFRYALLGLGSALVSKISNLRFGPEVGVGHVKKDVPVVGSWEHEMEAMVNDLGGVQAGRFPRVVVHQADARSIASVLGPNTVDGVITSPPYPNEKDYTRTTRLESVILGFAPNILEIRAQKSRLVRSNTRGVYKSDDDDRWIDGNKRVQDLARAIEERRIELGKTSGFERLYARVTKLYFGGMARHLADLTSILRPGARLAYVVGDQASYFRIMIRTGQILAEIAESVGYKVDRIDLFRSRFATATQSELREEVVILRWPGRTPGGIAHG